VLVRARARRLRTRAATDRCTTLARLCWTGRPMSSLMCIRRSNGPTVGWTNNVTCTHVRYTLDQTAALGNVLAVPFSQKSRRALSSTLLCSSQTEPTTTPFSIRDRRPAGHLVCEPRRVRCELPSYKNPYIPAGLLFLRKLYGSARRL